jgi:hypothetical protein
MNSNIQTASQILNQHSMQIYNLQKHASSFTEGIHTFNDEKIENSPLQEICEKIKVLNSNKQELQPLNYSEDNICEIKKFSTELIINNKDDCSKSQLLYCIDNTVNDSTNNKFSPCNTENQSSSFIGKTSFYIDALLSKASNQKDSDSCKFNKKLNLLINIKKKNLNLEITNPCKETKTIEILNNYTTKMENSENVLSYIREKNHSISKFELSNNSNNKECSKQECIQNVSPCIQPLLQFNKKIDINTEIDLNRTISVSPDSNASRSLTNSPPISPGFEENMGVLFDNKKNIVSKYYELDLNNLHGNRNFVFNSGNSLVYPGGAYYHSNSGSAFHTIQKEHSLGHLSSGIPHQHHIHSLQLEWLARSGMLYPRLSTDLASKIFLIRNFKTLYSLTTFSY